MNEFQQTQPVKPTDQQTNTWAMLLHFSQLLIYPIPIAGVIAPILIWQLKKDELPGIDVHGKIVANWLVTAFIGYVVCFALFFLVVPVFLAMALSVAHIAFAIIGGIKANSGEVWPYPMTLIKFF